MPVYYSYRIYNISLFDLCLTSFCTLYFMSCVCSTFSFYYCISTRTQIFPFFEILFGFIQIYIHIDRRQYSHMETFTKNNADDHIEQYWCAFICCFNMKRFFDNLNTKSITWWVQARACQLFFVVTPIKICSTDIPVYLSRRLCIMYVSQLLIGVSVSRIWLLHIIYEKDTHV